MNIVAQPLMVADCAPLPRPRDDVQVVRDLVDVDGRQVLLRAHNRHRGDTGERQNDQHDQSFLMAIPSTAGLQSRPTG